MAAQQKALLQQMQDHIAQMQTELTASAAATTNDNATAAAAAALEAIPQLKAMPQGDAGNDGFPPHVPISALSPALVNAGEYWGFLGLVIHL
jgi:hypothetical protein